MIRITRQSCPPSLSEHSIEWTEDLLKIINEGGNPPDSLTGHYREKDIKKAIREDAHDKCMYCESKISHVYSGDVEHLKPKSKYPESIFDWNNLGYVCAKCNNAKRDKYSEELPYIDPYQENPDESLLACGAMVFAKPQSKRGKITELDIEINRPELIEKRLERIRWIRSILDIYLSETNDELKKSLKIELDTELGNDKEYAMCSRNFVDDYKM